MLNSKYIISKENAEVLQGDFHPFKNESLHPTLPHPTSENILEKLRSNNSRLKEEAQNLQEEIVSLSSTKQALENEIREKEEKRNHLQLQEDNFKTQAQEEAQKIITEAKQQAETIVVEAQKQKESIEAEASKTKQHVTETRKAGYRDGFAKGYQKGEEERESIEAYLKKILNEAIRKKDQVIESIRPHLVELVFTAVRKVVKKITEEDKKVVLRNITDALRKIDDPVKCIIKVSYDDLKASTVFKSQLLSSLKGLQQVEVIADPSVEPGGCIVETEFTIVDSRISTQLEKIGMALNSLDVAKSSTY